MTQSISQTEAVAEGEMEMTVAFKQEELAVIFSLIGAFLMGIMHFILGLTIDLKIVKGILKRPVGPLVGIFCQYVMMPVVSMKVIRFS